MRRLLSHALCVLLAGWLSTPATTVIAQVCDTGTQVTYLDAGSSRFPVSNSGLLLDGLYLPEDGGSRFYVADRHPDISALEDMHVGVGGYANGELRMSGRFYSDYMLPGSLDEQGLPLSNTTDCVEADRIYRVSATDFREMNTDEDALSRIADWPAHLGAAVLDGDGVSDNYNIDGGDRPALIGDEMVWWQMNDGGRLHLTGPRSNAVPRVGLEVDAMVSASYTSSLIDLSLYRYTMRYVGEVPLDSAIVYIFANAVSGERYSDEMGSDSIAGLAYVFSPISDPLLGTNAPSAGVQVLRGPTVDDDGVDNDHDGLTDEAGEELRPTMISGYWDLNESEEDAWAYYIASNGCPPIELMIESRGCVPSTDIAASDKRVRYWAPDDPATRVTWMADDVPYDREVMISMGPFTWLPGEEKTIEFATLWVEATSSIEAAHNIREYARNLLMVRDDLYLASIPESTKTEGVKLPEGFTVSLPYPNPAADNVTFSIALPTEARVVIKLYDALGRSVWSRSELLTAGLHEVPLDVRGLGSGTHFYRVEIGSGSAAGIFFVAN